MYQRNGGDGGSEQRVFVGLGMDVVGFWERREFESKGGLGVEDVMNGRKCGRNASSSVHAAATISLGL